MDDPILSIKERIAAQGKRLCPPLTGAEVTEFEVKHGVTLPEGYRRFLIEVANGGEGPPHYGLASLGSGPRSSYRPETAYWEQLPDVAKPFPFTKPWVWEDEDSSDEGTQEQVRHGSIYLGTDGCGMDWHLIVTGPERGNIWLITGEGMQPTSPKRDFLTWYSKWLDGLGWEDWWGGAVQHR
jgi:SMI1 / KNR4 family (SUKH-1)